MSSDVVLDESRLQAMSGGPWQEPGNPVGRAGAALRCLTDWVLRTGDPERLEQAAADMEELLQRLGPADRESRYVPADVPSDGTYGTLNPNSGGSHPAVGVLNPVAPPITLYRSGDQVFGDVTYDTRFEGMPGWVHGGVVAVGFDMVLGQNVRLRGDGGPTGTLQVRFLRPAKVNEPLRYEGWFDGSERRKRFAAARLVQAANGEVCAEASGVFIVPSGPQAA